MKKQIGEESIPKLIISNVMPAILSMVMSLAYNMADMFFVAQTNDDLQVAAVLIASPIFMIFMALSLVFGMGGTSLIARSFGKGDAAYAKRVSAFCFWSLTALGLSIGAVLFIFAQPIAKLFGASSNTMILVVEYLSILSLVSPFSLITSAFSNIIRAEGAPKTAAMGMVIGNVINIALDPVFILGFGLGISGAAIATVIGNMSAALFYILFMTKGKSKLSIKIKDFTFDKNTIREVLKIGIPSSLASLVMSISTILINGFMANYGDLAVAGMGVSMRITTITSYVCIGFGLGVQPLFGHAFGAKNFNKFKDIMKYSLIFSLVMGVALWGFCLISLDFLVSAFLNDAQAYDYAMSFSKVLLSSSCVLGMLFVFINSMQAIGAASASLILNISRRGLFFIPLVLIMNHAIGLYGAVYAQPISDFISCAVAFLIYNNVSKKMTSNAVVLQKGVK